MRSSLPTGILSKKSEISLCWVCLVAMIYGSMIAMDLWIYGSIQSAQPPASADCQGAESCKTSVIRSGQPPGSLRSWSGNLLRRLQGKLLHGKGWNGFCECWITFNWKFEGLDHPEFFVGKNWSRRKPYCRSSMGQKTQMCPFHICGSCVSKDLENHPRSMQWSLPHVPGVHHELRLAREWTWKPVTQHFHCSGRFGKRTVRVWKSWAWLTPACTATISLCLASAIGKGGEIHLHTHSRCSMYRLIFDSICEICII